MRLFSNRIGVPPGIFLARWVVVSGARRSIRREGKRIRENEASLYQIQKSTTAFRATSLGDVLREKSERTAREASRYSRSHGAGQALLRVLAERIRSTAPGRRNGQFARHTIKEFIARRQSRGSAAESRATRSTARSSTRSYSLSEETGAQAAHLARRSRSGCSTRSRKRARAVSWAAQDDFFAMLRYEKGGVTALCHEKTEPRARTCSLREEFLVKI